MSKIIFVESAQKGIFLFWEYLMIFGPSLSSRLVDKCGDKSRQFCVEGGTGEDNAREVTRFVQNRKGERDTNHPNNVRAAWELPFRQSLGWSGGER